MTKLPNHEPNSRLVTPFRVDAAYESSPGRISTVTVPPSAALILPGVDGGGADGAVVGVDVGAVDRAGLAVGRAHEGEALPVLPAEVLGVREPVGSGRRRDDVPRARARPCGSASARSRSGREGRPPFPHHAWSPRKRRCDQATDRRRELLREDEPPARRRARRARGGTPSCRPRGPACSCARRCRGRAGPAPGRSPCAPARRARGARAASSAPARRCRRPRAAASAWSRAASVVSSHQASEVSLSCVPV